MRTTVHVVRHGEVHNPGQVLYGRLPGFELSAAGEAMAVATAQSLADRDITYVVSSPLERARQTAKPFAEPRHLEVRIDDRLIEAANIFQGRRIFGPTSLMRYPGTWAQFRNPFRPSWGEAYQQIALRMFAAVRSARDQAAGHEAVCVSHQLPIVALRRYVEGQRLWHDPRKRQCGLASVTSLTFHDERVVSVEYTDPAALPRS